MKGFIDQIKLFQTYKAFYGKSPNFDDENEEMKFQLITCLLNEYDVFEGSFEDWNYYGDYVCSAPVCKEFIYTPFSYDVRDAYERLKGQLQRLTEEEIDQIYCDYCSFVDIDGIRAISNIVFEYIRKKNANPIEFLKKLSNVLRFRLQSSRFLAEHNEEPKTIIAREFVIERKELGYPLEEVEEIMDFISCELGLSSFSLARVSPIYSIQKAEENGMQVKIFNSSDCLKKRLLKY